jgi:hypothetical protein
MDVPKRAFIFALSQHSIRWLGTQRARSADNRRREDGVERVGAERIAQERVPTVPNTVSIPGLLAGYRDRMVAQGGCREPEAVGHCYRRHLHQPGRVSGLSYYDQ